MLKIFFSSVLLFVQPITAQAQWIDIPSSAELALNRIERALREGNPESITDLFPGGIQMRIEDSLYQSIPSIYAMEKLDRFFADKDSIDFRFGLPGSGTLHYTKDEKRESVAVEVWLRRDRGEILIYALNISNYPTATIFFNIPRKEPLGK